MHFRFLSTHRTHQTFAPPHDRQGAIDKGGFGDSPYPEYCTPAALSDSHLKITGKTCEFYMTTPKLHLGALGAIHFKN